MLDKTDEQIVHMLEENGRRSFLDIAKELGVAESTVRKRVNVLERDGTIQKYAAQLDPNKMGFGSIAYVGIDVEPEQFLHVSKRLAEFDAVRFVATTSGDHTIMTQIWAKDGDELRGFIQNSIETIPGVTRTCPAVVTETIKSA